MRKDKPTTDKICHVYNRGVEKRNIFLEKADYLRFTRDLLEFNNQNPALKVFAPISEVGLPNNVFEFEKKPWVEILTFVQMPNHFHLLLKQLCDNGITEFMRKLGTGYTNYFNQKYDRVGPLFQGKYKSITLQREEHLLHLPYYIHSNPLDLIMPDWKEKGINDHRRCLIHDDIVE